MTEPPSPVSAEQELSHVAYLAAIGQRDRYKEQRDRLAAELRAAQEREQTAYARILNALDPHHLGYTRQALDGLRRFARERSGLSDEQAEALAAQRPQAPAKQRTEEACPDHNPRCDGTSLLHGDWCKEPRCDYCGDLGWTVRKYGRITHKEACPHRTDPWSQTYPQRTEETDG